MIMAVARMVYNHYGIFSIIITFIACSSPSFGSDCPQVFKRCAGRRLVGDCEALISDDAVSIDQAIAYLCPARSCQLPSQTCPEPCR